MIRGAFLENVREEIRFAGEELDKVWKNMIPLSLSYDHETWVEKCLLICNSQEEACAAFNEKFVTEDDHLYASAKVFTMTMNKDESISMYTTRFVKSVLEDKLDKDNEMIAQMFLVSLTEEVQREAKIACYSNKLKNKAWTLDQVSKIARDVLSGNPAKYYSRCGTNVSMYANHSVYGDNTGRRKTGEVGGGAAAGVVKANGNDTTFFLYESRNQ